MSLQSTIRRLGRKFGIDIARTRYQLTLSTHLLRVFEALHVNCVLDVGAHEGEYGDGLREAGYRGSLVSFEPVATVHAVLAARAAKDRDWRTHRMALSDHDGTAAIHVMSGSVMTSFHPLTAYAKTRFPGLSVTGSEEVPVRRLAGILDDAVSHVPNPRLFLKMDTQGHDLAVLEGARDGRGARGEGGAIDQRIVAIQSEVSVKPLYEGVQPLSEVLVRLKGLGFEPTGMFPVSRDADDLRLVEVDLIAIRA